MIIDPVRVHHHDHVLIMPRTLLWGCYVSSIVSNSFTAALTTPQIPCFKSKLLLLTFISYSTGLTLNPCTRPILTLSGPSGAERVI